MSCKYMGFAFVLVLLVACNKYLDEPNSNNITIAKTVQDAKLLMRNASTMNVSSASFGELSADNYYVPNDVFQGLNYDAYRELYVWGTDLYTGVGDPWAAQYHKIYMANLALETLKGADVTSADKVDYNFAKGSALFFRAYTFWKTATVWCKAYDDVSAKSELGLPLKLSTNYNQVPKRSSLYDTYQQIINDLKEAAILLPNTSSYQQDPNRVACFGELSRVFLSMRDYVNAGKYADSCLKLYHTIIDFNQVAIMPVLSQNSEIIFYTEMMSAGVFSSAYLVDSSLYNSYSDDDLRKSLYYAAPGGSSQKFIGSYGRSSGVYFSGIATDEIYMNRAECLARSGNVEAALADLNYLGQNRYRNFIPFKAVAVDSLVNLILIERRKELAFRDLRWMDIKRLNMEGRDILLNRFVGGVEYMLRPNDNKFALPLPPVDVASGIEQNPR